jgi:hypothetical protein
MKIPLSILCVVAIVVNVYFGIFYEEAKEEWTDKINIDDDVIDYSEFDVTVPELMVGDTAQYDYSIFAEMYWENKSSGEWEKYTLNANGQLVDRVPSLIEKQDGFGVKRQTLNFREETAATFSISIDSSDGESFTAHGSLDGSRDEFTELAENKVIQVITDGSVEVDQIRQIPIPISYDGRMRNYPDPNLDRKESIDEQIFLGNKTLEIGDSGSIFEEAGDEISSEWYSQQYNWSVVGGEKVSDYDTLIVNITTGFFQNWMPFVKQVWISNEVSFPVKVFVRTNSSAEDKNGSFYTIIEHTRTLKTDGFSRGTQKVPWENSGNADFLKKHSMGEFKFGEYMPMSGNRYDRSSFDYKPDEAVDYALKNSNGLKQFLNKYDHNDRVVITSANYKVLRDAKDELDPSGKAGSYNWNITFSYNPTREEIIDAWYSDDRPDWGYVVNLTRNVTKEAGIDKYSEEIKIINEFTSRRSSPYSRDEFPSELLTLDSSELILKQDPEIEEKVFTTIDGEINFRDTTYGLVMGDITASNMPGLDIIESITGITTPTSKYSWSFQKGSVYQAGNTFTAAVDVETGQLLFVMEISGTELYGLFS